MTALHLIPTMTATQLTHVKALTIMVLPSNSVWLHCEMALYIASSVANATLPVPLDLPVSLSVMTAAYVISPANEKCCLKPSLVVSNDSPPT